MARTAGVDIPRDKRAVAPLTYIRGIGNTTTKKVLANVDVSGDVRVRDLTNEQADVIRAEIDKSRVEGDLRREVNLNIKRLMEIDSYRGIHHCCGLPIRGQGTKDNVRARKGPTKTIAGKKK